MARTESSGESRLFQRVVVTGALIGAGFVAGLLALRPSIDGVGRLTDGRQTFSAYDLGVRKVIYEADPKGPRFVLPEGVTRYCANDSFVVAQFGERGADAELRVAPVPEAWGTEVRSWRAIPSLAAASDELSPVLRQTASGEELLFSSDRFGSVGGLDLWSSRVQRSSDGAPIFADPIPLRGLNTVVDESDPAPLPRALGGGLVFVRDRDLHLQRRAGLAPTRMDALSSAVAESEPAAGEYGLYFTRTGEDGRSVVLRSAFTAPSAGEPRAWRAPSPVGLPRGLSFASAPRPSLDETRLRVVEEGGTLLSLRSRPLEMRPGASDLALWILLGFLLLLALLASLSHRWRGLEIVTKCLLLSLLLHLLALWAMRYLYPAEPEPLQEERAPRIRLRLDAPSDGPSARNSARGGSLEGLTFAPSEVSDSALPEFTLEGRTSRSLAALSPAAASEIDAPTPRAADPRVPQADVTGESLAVTASSEASRIEEVALSSSLMDGPTVVQATAPQAPRGIAGSRPGELQVQRGPVVSAEVPGPAVQVASSAASGAGSKQAETMQAETMQAPPSARSTALATAAPAAGLSLPPPRSSPSARGGFEEAMRPTVELGDLEIDAPVLASGGVSGASSAAPPEVVFEFEPQDFEPVLPRADSAEEIALPTLTGLADLSPNRPAVELQAPPLEPPAAPTLAIAEPPRPELLAPPARVETAPLPVNDARPPAAFDDPFAARFGELKEEALERLGGSEETEAAVARGLAYLAERQTKRGTFGTTRSLDDKYGDTRVGKTGLALLAFLGAGHLPESRSPYADHVTRGLAWLCRVQVPAGEPGAGHFGDTSAYSHAIATYALSEAYALQPLPDLLPYLRRAVRRIEQEQQRSTDARFDGGWGYYYPDGHTFDRWPRVSVTSWQVMALCSAKRAGMEIDAEGLEAARGFLKGAWDERRGAYRYTHDPERLSSGMPILPGSTGAALFALSLLGEDPGGDEFAEARSFLVQRRPRSYGYEGDRAFVRQAQGNLYFSYTASLALIAAGEESDWRRFNVDMTETLLEAQQENGSWRPDSPYADYAQDTGRDRIYTTAIAVLCLEVYYRYLTPLVKPFATERE